MKKSTGNRICKHLRRTQRQEAAKLRQAEREKLTDAQQLAIIKKRPGQSLREHTRLTARLSSKA